MWGYPHGHYVMQYISTAFGVIGIDTWCRKLTEIGSGATRNYSHEKKCILPADVYNYNMIGVFLPRLR